MYDLNSLQDALSTNVTNSVSSGVEDQISKIIAWVVVPSIILTVILLAAYIAHIVHRHKVDKAIFEIRDTLREMKLAGSAPATPWPTPEQPTTANTSTAEPGTPPAPEA
jgi:L-lactate permease